MEIFTAPQECENLKPNINTLFENVAKYNKEFKAYQDSIIEVCKEDGSGKYKGKVFTYPVADGYAEYAVLSLRPLRVIHMGSEYHADEIVSMMKASDVTNKVDQEENLKAIFS